MPKQTRTIFSILHDFLLFSCPPFTHHSMGRNAKKWNCRLWSHSVARSPLTHSFALIGQSLRSLCPFASLAIFRSFALRLMEKIYLNVYYSVASILNGFFPQVPQTNFTAQNTLLWHRILHSCTLKNISSISIDDGCQNSGRRNLFDQRQTVIYSIWFLFVLESNQLKGRLCYN